MKRRWNLSLWAGLLLVFGAPAAYILYFVRFPVTRDFPWTVLLMFAAGLALIARGVRRAYREPALYRGRIAGPIVATLALVAVALMVYQLVFATRDLPASGGAPKVGERAPDFALPDQDGREVTLASLLAPEEGAPGGKANGAVLIFYRGYW